jgi:hypothetical protein
MVNRQICLSERRCSAKVASVKEYRCSQNYKGYKW